MKNCICQSCGMPLKTPDLYGTDKQGLRIEDYCVYCYNEGAFTEDVTMKEMIRLCARYVEGNSRDYAIANMKIQFPRLKRWSRKEETQHEYHKSINRVLEYIQEHLDESTDLKTLAAIACLSPYHFHRIFKSTIGESLAEYVQRLRLEYVAGQLKASDLSLNELAARTGYSSEQSLSRAFKKYFNLPPSIFKASFFGEKFNKELVPPRICKVAEKNIITLREIAPNEKRWQRLYMYAMVNQLLTETSESLEIIHEDVFYPGLTTTNLLSSNQHIDAICLPESLYAIFTYKGSTGRLSELYHAILSYWLPASKYTLSPMTPYVKYLNNTSTVQQDDLLSEIYIPVVEK